MSRMDRRLAPRVETEVSIRWTVPRQKRRDVVEVNEPAVVGDASLSGLQIRARTAELLTTGSVVPIVCQGVEGYVSVRWIGPSEERDVSLHGVKLISPSNELLGVLLAGTGLLEAATLRDELIMSLLIAEPV